MTTRADIEVVRIPPGTVRVEGQQVPYCEDHPDVRLRAGWRRFGRRIWRFYWCPPCDVPSKRGSGRGF